MPPRWLLVAFCCALASCSDTTAGTGSGGGTANAGRGFNVDGLGGGDSGDGTSRAASVDATGQPGEDSGAASDASTDGSTGDGSAGSDSAKPDIGAAGDFGKPCKGDSDCESGWCIEGYNGYFCTQTCSGGCPKGYLCSKIFTGKAAQPVFLCTAPVNKLCKPCQSDLDCAGGACIDSNGEKFCASACGDKLAPCPSSHTCKPLPNPDGSGSNSVCMPNSGTCACTAKSAGLVRACQHANGPLTCFGLETCAAGKWGDCQLPAETCNGQDDDCNGTVDDGFKDANGQYSTVQACGQCGINCAVLQGANAKAACAAKDGGFACKLQCDEGWFDVDDNPKNGCECTVTSATDEPDGPDQNCDGIDGEVQNGVFVALTGKDSNDGSIGSPLGTIGAAIAKAAKAGKRDVYVATGVYEASLLLQVGVHVYGGYSADFKKHDPAAYETVVLGSKPTADLPGAVNAIALKGKATLDGFSVYGVSVKDKGASTYGVYVRDCGADLRIRHNKVIAGDAAAGVPGAAGPNGTGGTAGTAGSPAKDNGKATCSAADNTLGGKGGTQTCGGVDTSGGGGGTAICPDYDEDGAQPKSSPYKQTLTATEQGIAGKGTGGGAGGASGYDGLIWEGSSSNCGICNPPKAKDGDPFLYTLGKNGADGKDGAAGNSGAGCNAADGSVTGGLWQPGSAGSGGAGAAGGGGGGGGAGGGVEVSTACKTDALFKNPDLGGSGGGGGSGGCGANGGKAGGSGGGSFGLFIVFTGAATALPEVAKNSFVTGNGGDGAPGGFGGVGGIGGDGQFGGGDDPAGLAWCASGGGRGGQGGNGGHGGGGGGGCGGVSFGIFVAGGIDPKPLAQSGNSVMVLGIGGQGGAGGKSLGKSGGDGVLGSYGAANFPF